MTLETGDVPMARPVIGAEEEEAVLEVLRDRQLSLGPRGPRFEQLFAAQVGAEHASAVSSGTAGLHLALRAAGVSDGDEVVTTPLSFVATANAVVYERATPVFADIDPVTLNIDTDAAAAAVTSRTTAILPAHIFGYPADVAALQRLARPVVEDAAQALGASFPDATPVGGNGNLAVFAFYANKQLTTGEGGLVISPDPATKAIIDSERNQGRAPDMDWLDHDRLGFNYRLSDVACAIGIAQLGRLETMLAQRSELAAAYGRALEPLVSEHGLQLPCPDGSGSGGTRGWFVYVVQLPVGGADRDDVIRSLRSGGVASKPYLPAIHLMSYYRERFGFRKGMFPVAESVAERSLALPFFPGMTEAQLERVAGALSAALRS